MDTDELLTYIEQNIKEGISLVDLAQVVRYSPRQIYYIVKEAYSKKHVNMRQNWILLMLRQLVAETEQNSFISCLECRSAEELRTEFMSLGASLRRMMR